MKIFEVVGQSFFAPLTSKHKQIYVDCIEIIINACSVELAYNVDKESIIEKLVLYFEATSREDIQFEEEEEILRDSRTKACSALRNLERYGWVEVNSDYRQTTVSVLDQSVSIFKTLQNIASQEEAEYRTEISQIYALLTNEEFRQHPYSMIIEPVSKRTDDLITGLKKLNTNIKKYINQMAEKITFNDVMDNFAVYINSNVSDAYNRLKTSEHIAKFRFTIVDNLREIRSDRELFEKAVAEYAEQKKVEESVAREDIQEMLLRVVDVFNSYDELIKEIEKKNTRYLQSAVDRIKFLNMNTNDVETRISVILQTIQKELEGKEKEEYFSPLSDDYSSIFNLYPQNFISNDSLYVVPVDRGEVEVEEVVSMPVLTEEEKMMKIAAAHALIDNDFDVKKVNDFIIGKMGEKEKVKVSEMEIEEKKDFMKVIYSIFFAKDRKAKYQIHFLDNSISKCGWKFKDFELKKK